MQTTHATALTTEQLTLAREWIADCSFADLDDSALAEMSDWQIERGVRQHFAGGIESFVLMCA